MFLPEGYDEFVLCTELYHCTPSELEQQPNAIAQRDLAIWNGIQTVKKQQQQRQAANRK